MYHHGIKGMKWGVRRYQKKDGSLTPAGQKRNRFADDRANSKIIKADKKIDKLNKLRTTNKTLTRNADSSSRAVFKEGSKKLKSNLAYNKVNLKRTEVVNKYKIAKQEAKKDPSYKQSAEYKKAKQAHSKQRTNDILHGPAGSTKIQALQEQGYTRKKAVAKTYVDSALTGIAITALVAVANSKYN